MIFYSLHCFSKPLRNFVILYSSNCKTSEDFEASINIIYRTVKNMMNENDTLEI